ncbi:CPBP family intramembrane glutamic endopeptidase [Paenibacillus donghaensis]|nr:CPBP family intramembrane glutamic endopeptidase [Paenibacillus donghaensis]
MNPVGQPLQQRALSKRLLSAGIIGVLLFALFQIYPQLMSSSPDTDTTVISKSEAKAQAARFAAQKLGLQADAEDHWGVVYQSDSDFYGYMSREKLLGEYAKQQLDQRYPFDVFHVTLYPASSAVSNLSVDLNMYTGEPVGFSTQAETSASGGTGRSTSAGSSPAAASEDAAPLSLQQQESLARPWLQEWGVNPSKLQIEPGTGDFTLVYSNSSVTIGESRLMYKFSFSPQGKVNQFKAGFTAPGWHTSYVEDQVTLGTRLNLYGYYLPTIALALLALIYSILRRSHTSFARGAFLSVVHFAIMMGSTYNSLPETFSDSPDARLNALILFVIYTLFSLLMSLMLYFSLVAGDGLWRKEEGLNPWPRAHEPGYGQYVLDSIKVGYVWAFVLLGVQSLMFLVLSFTLNNWYTTDPAQSPFNMKYAWLLPAVAWLAGLSEEAIYRLFGIRMLQKIVRNTFAACLITTLIWAFGHTLYPIYPVSSRPIELTVVGLLFSYIFLRYGFIAAMFSHVVFDSILIGSSLIFMREPVNITAGAVSIILPFLVAYIVYWFNRRRPPAEPFPAARKSLY